MITYAVCLYRREVFESVCAPALIRQQHFHRAQIVLTESTLGICRAYEEARQKAKHETIVYLHDDLELLDDDATPRILRALDDSGAGVLGVVGSAPAETVACPWWKADRFAGRWVAQVDGRQVVQYSIGDALGNSAYREGARHWRGDRSWVPAELLDGILLADRTDLPWPKVDGWHGYDVDRCMAARAAGHTVAVGDVLVCHHNQRHDAAWRESIEPAMRGQAKKWGIEAR